jgi:hypothetical protein
MNNSTKRQFQEADAAVERAVTDFMSKIEPMFVKWEAVASVYILERVLLALCTEASKLADDPVLSSFVGDATLRLSNAVADYRDSRPEDRVPG